MNQTSKIIIFILISANAFANINFITEQKEINSKKEISLEQKEIDNKKEINLEQNKILSFLQKKGIQENSINNIKKKLPKEYEKRISELTMRIKKAFPDISIQNVHETIMMNVLNGDYSMYKNYDSRVGLLQKSYKIALSKNDYDKIEKL